MGILNWLGFGSVPEVRSETPPEQPAQGSGVIPPSRAEAFTTDSALSLSMVYRSVMILGTAAMQLTLDVWRGGEPVDPLPSLLRRPDVDSTLSAVLEQTVVSMAVAGDAYWRVFRNARGEATSITVLNPWECTEDAEKKTLHWRDKDFTEKEFYHLRLMRVPGRVNGLGPIQACRLELAGIKDLRDFSSGWFESGDTPSGVLKTDQVLTPDQAAQWKAAWQERQFHEVAVLGNGLEYSPVLLSPKDAQFLESQQFSVTQVARLFGIPARLLLAAVEGSSMTYSNVAQEDLTFVRWTLMRYLREIEEAFSFLLPGIQTARFNLDALLRPDTKTRYESHQIGLSAKFLTPNEVRAMEGLSPIPGGNKVTATPAPPAPASPAPAPAEQPDDEEKS